MEAVRRSRMEAERARGEARAAARLKATQQERVNELRHAEAGSAALQAQKVAHVATVEAQLQQRMAGCRSFSQLLSKLCGVEAASGSTPDLQKAYKKALAKHHPDRAQVNHYHHQNLLKSWASKKLIVRCVSTSLPLT